MAKEKLIIFDTTMRDGEQSPGASMSKEEKLRIARHLERMHVDVIEAGFPASSVNQVTGGRSRFPRSRRSGSSAFRTTRPSEPTAFATTSFVSARPGTSSIPNSPR